MPRIRDHSRKASITAGLKASARGNIPLHLSGGNRGVGVRLPPHRLQLQTKGSNASLAQVACTGWAACGATAVHFPPSSSLDFKTLSVNMKEAMLHVMRGSPKTGDREPLTTPA